ASVRGRVRDACRKACALHDAARSRSRRRARPESARVRAGPRRRLDPARARRPHLVGLRGTARVTSALAATLAPDPVFAQRDDLLDLEALRARLSRLLGEEVASCEQMRATYHPGWSLRLLWRVELEDGSRRLVSARAFARGGSRSRFERAHAVAGDLV